MKQKKKILSKYKRKLIIDGREWTYRVTTKTFHICNPERTKKWTFGHAGYTPCECSCHYYWDDCYDECISCAMHGCEGTHTAITPGYIASVIKRLDK